MNLDEDRSLAEDESLVPVALRDEDRLLIVFAYLGPLAFVSLAAARNDFVRWHARQGILLGATTLLTFLLLRPIHSLLYKIWPFLGQIFQTLEILVAFGFFMAALLCLVRGLEGVRFRLPFLADIVERF